MDDINKQYFWLGMFATGWILLIMLSIMHSLMWLLTKEYFGEMLGSYFGTVLVYVVIYMQKKQIKNLGLR